MSTAEILNNNIIFPKGDKAPSSYFTGTAWVMPLVPDDNNLNVVVSNVVFEPGARNHWHTHPGGQILVVTYGTGYYQEKGKAARLLQKGDVVSILPGVEHWHGASPESEFTHLAINPNTQKGIVYWFAPVTEEEYGSLRK